MEFPRTKLTRFKQTNPIIKKITSRHRALNRYLPPELKLQAGSRPTHAQFMLFKRVFYKCQKHRRAPTSFAGYVMTLRELLIGDSVLSDVSRLDTYISAGAPEVDIAIRDLLTRVLPKVSHHFSSRLPRDYTNTIVIWLNCQGSGSCLTSSFLTQLYTVVAAQTSLKTISNVKSRFVIHELSPICATKAWRESFDDCKYYCNCLHFISETVFLKFTLPIFQARFMSQLGISKCIVASSLVRGCVDMISPHFPARQFSFENTCALHRR
jgi:hypothetical protein